jgi:hypothetical protein
MKITCETANKHIEEKSQSYARYHDEKAILYPYKEGDLVLL